MTFFLFLAVILRGDTNEKLIANNFSVSQANYIAIISMKNEFGKNQMFWFLAHTSKESREKTNFIVVMLLLFCLHAFAPIIPHNLSFANKQLFKRFSVFCSNNGSKIQWQEQEIKKNRRIMQKKQWIFAAYTNYAFML